MYEVNENTFMAIINSKYKGLTLKKVKNIFRNKNKFMFKRIEELTELFFAILGEIDPEEFTDIVMKQLLNEVIWLKLNLAINVSYGFIKTEELNLYEG